MICDEVTLLSVPQKWISDINSKQVKQTSKLGKFILQQRKKADVTFNPDEPQNCNTLINKIKSKNYKLIELLTDVVLDGSVNIKSLLEETSNHKNLRYLPGNIYEGLWLIVILINKHPLLNTDKFEICEDKIENINFLLGYTTIKKLDVYKYLNNTNVQTGNQSGISDITLRIKKKDYTDEWACDMDFQQTKYDIYRYVFSSCKYFNNEEKDVVHKYDIANIIQVISDHYKQNRLKAGTVVDIEYNILLFIKDKIKFFKKLENTKKKYIKEDLEFSLNENETFQINTFPKPSYYNSIYDLSDIVKIIDDIRKDNEINNVISIIKSRSPVKPVLSPRFHQLLIVNKTLKLISHDLNNNTYLPIVWGLIARSGKTYTAGLLISKMNREGYFKKIKILKKKKILMFL